MRPRIVNSSLGLVILLGLIAASHPARAEITLSYGGTSATTLPDGRVLLAGGSGVFDALTQCLLFDLSVGTFTLTAPMSNKRVGHGAVLLQDGRVLVIGGGDSKGLGIALSTVELYDPASATWSPVEPMAKARRGLTATRLPDGKVLVAGGNAGSGIIGGFNSAEIYDPATGHWSAAGVMVSSRDYHTSTLLSDGRVLVAGGRTDPPGIPAQAELFDPVSKTWTATTPLTDIRYQHRATLLANGKVLVAGGITGASYAEIYDPATATWAPTGPMTPSAVADPGLTLLPDGKVLVSGGAFSTQIAQLYDPASNLWTAARSMSKVRVDHTLTLLRNGWVMAYGGNASSQAEYYDPQTNLWSTAAPPPSAPLPTPVLTLPSTLTIIDTVRETYPSGTTVAQFLWTVTPTAGGTVKTQSTPIPELPLAPLTFAPGPYRISLQASDGQGHLSSIIQADVSLVPPTLTLDIPAVLPANGQVTLTPPPNTTWANFEWDFQKQNSLTAASSEGRTAARIGQVHVITGNRTIHLGEYGLDLGAYQVSVNGVDTYGNHSTTAQASFQLVAMDLSAVQVFPSPWKSDLHSGHDLTFGNLPSDSTVKIFSLDGRWVKTLAGVSGNTPWNLKNEDGRNVASGIYLYLITSSQGQTKGKFVVVR